MTTSGGRWVELADGVLARRYTELDLTAGLILGSRYCLVVDTRGDSSQGGELAAAVRAHTSLRWHVVYTHAHFDHCFGTAAFLPCAVWAHEGCARQLATHGETIRTRTAAWYREEGKPQIADAVERTRIAPPGQLLRTATSVDLGDREVRLIHPGTAHTDHDLIVYVPDAGVLFAGDVLEQSPSGFTTESFGSDADLAGWPHALDRLLALDPAVLVPGHGDPVDQEFVATERAKLTRLVALRDARTDSTLTVEDAIAHSPYPAEVTRAALNAG